MSGRFIARLAAALLLLLPFLAFSAPTSQAHDTLKQSIPKAGSTTEPVDAVSLIFSANVLKTGAAVQVKGPSGEVTDGAAQVTSALVTQKLKTPMPNGVYTVTWRVLSSDGHPISGRYSFTVAGPPTSSAPATNSTDAITPTTKGNGTPTPPAQQKPTDSTNNSPVLIITAAVLALLLIAGGAWFAKSRLKDDDADAKAERAADNGPARERDEVAEDAPPSEEVDDSDEFGPVDRNSDTSRDD